MENPIQDDAEKKTEMVGLNTHHANQDGSEHKFDDGHVTQTQKTHLLFKAQDLRSLKKKAEKNPR